MKKMLNVINVKAMLLFVALFLSASLMAACQDEETNKESPAQPSGTTTPSGAISAQTCNVQMDGALGKLSAVLFRPELKEGEKSAFGHSDAWFHV